MSILDLVDNIDNILLLYSCCNKSGYKYLAWTCCIKWFGLFNHCYSSEKLCWSELCNSTVVLWCYLNNNEMQWSLIFNAFQHLKITPWLRAVHTFLVASYTLSLLQVYFEPATLLNRAATTPGTSCPTLFRQVCGFFNGPQNFRVEGIVRRDLRLIALIREDLKV